MERRTFVATGIATGALSVFAPVLRATQHRPPLRAVTLDGKAIEIGAASVAELAQSMRGDLLSMASPGYDDARRLWNASFDRRPALIARCAGASDVMKAVSFARAHQLLLAVRCGGHSGSGKSSCDDGLVIDLTRMRDVRVDPKARTARVAGGALLRDFDTEAQAFGLVATAGTVSHTGVGGLTLGGGLGTLVRKYGMTIDHLVGAEVVTADGKLVRASADEHPDLFWGLRGGGGNFGVVTSFEFRLHEFGPLYPRGVWVFPFDRARQVLNYLKDVNASLTDDQNLTFSLISPPDNQRIMTVHGADLRSLEHTEKLLAPLRKIGRPFVDNVAAVPYLRQQQASDVSLGGGSRGYLKSGFVPELNDAYVDALLECCGKAELPTIQLVDVPHLGGAMARVPASATAFPHRDASHALMVHSYWPDTQLEQPGTRWVRESWATLEPMTRGVYSNFLSSDDQRPRVLDSYGTNYDRMVEVKTQYDPTNQFRLNANVEPRRA